MDTVKSGLGVEIYPTANITINGAGLPNTGDLKVALIFAFGSDTLQNLKAGLQDSTISNGIYGSVTLNNVNLGPIAL